MPVVLTKKPLTIPFDLFASGGVFPVWPLSPGQSLNIYQVVAAVEKNDGWIRLLGQPLALSTPFIHLPKDFVFVQGVTPPAVLGIVSENTVMSIEVSGGAGLPVRVAGWFTAWIEP